MYITETEIDGNKFYRVRVGKFYIKDEVSCLAKTLADEGYDVFITQ